MSEHADIVRTDSRGRLSLGSRVEQGRWYSASVDEYGTITLIPVEITPVNEQEENQR